MNRRQALLAIPATASALPTLAFSPPSCQTHTPTSDVVVDVHCHILNVRDVDRNQFVARRVFEIDERHDLLKSSIAFAANIAYGFAGINTISVTEENQLLHQYIPEWRRNPERFCSRRFTPAKLVNLDTDRYEIDSDGDGNGDYRHPTAGFWNTRINNAVRLMREYPEIDLFTPSMVDFNEGNPDRYSNPDTNSVVYERVAQATFGRMLPMVCFNPQREVEWRQNKRRGGTPQGNGPLELVRVAIEKRGFIGVKLHPSVGFSPAGNDRFGCPNFRTQNVQQVDYHRKHLGKQLDAALMDLYEYCMANEVPILTHGSTGIPAFRSCMQPDGAPVGDWTNSTSQWGGLINEMVKKHPGQKALKVCIGHFAGAFSEKTPWLGWLDTLCAQMKDQDSLYVDLSIQTGLVDEAGAINAANVQRFHELLAAEPILNERTMYGSDWHMLAVAQAGPRYYKGIQGLLPTNIQSAVMGRTALKFLGLRKNDLARHRINAYYDWLKKKGRWPQDFHPTWLKKTDALVW